MKRVFALCLFLLPLGATAQVFSGSCSVSAVSLNFGAYNPFRAAHSDSVGNIAVSCSARAGDTVSYTIALSTGVGGSGFAQRHTRGQTEHLLHYNLYTSASRTMVWGDGNHGSAIVSDTFVQTTSRVTRNYPVYARVFGGQNIHVGTYTDSVVVTLNF